MSTGLIFIIIGLALSAMAFLFSISNLVRGINGDSGSFERTFKGHAGAMAVMAIGGVVMIMGLVMVGADFIQKL